MNKEKDNDNMQNASDKKEKSAWQNAKDMKNAALREAEQKQQQLAAQRESEREEYEKKLYQEKVELLRKKQGVSDDESEEIVDNIQREYSIRQKIGNFFYHNKWWLLLGSIFVAIFAYLIYDTVTATKYDMQILLISCDNGLYANQEKLLELFEKNCEDVNGDGEVNVAMLYYAPGTEAINNSIYYTNESALAAQFKMGDTIVVIADPTLDDTIYPQETLVDLEKYIESENITSYGYYVNDTAFAQICGLEELAYEDMYIGLRKVTQGVSYEEEMQENFEIALNTLKGVAEDIDNYSAPQSAE